MFHISSWPCPDSARFKPKSHTRRSSQIVSWASWSASSTHTHTHTLMRHFLLHFLLPLSLSLSLFILISDELLCFLPASEIKALPFKNHHCHVPCQTRNFPRMQHACTEARYRKSFEVKKLNYFISHCWKDERFAKVGPCRHAWMVVCFWRSLIWTLLVPINPMSFLRVWTNDSQCRASFMLFLKQTRGCIGGTSCAVLMFWHGEVIALLMNNNLNVAMVGSTLVEPWHLRGVLVLCAVTLATLGGPIVVKLKIGRHHNAIWPNKRCMARCFGMWIVMSVLSVVCQFQTKRAGVEDLWSVAVIATANAWTWWFDLEVEATALTILTRLKLLPVKKRGDGNAVDHFPWALSGGMLFFFLASWPVFTLFPAGSWWTG